MVKLGALVLGTAALFAASALLLTWWRGPLDQVGGQRWRFQLQCVLAAAGNPPAQPLSAGRSLLALPGHRERHFPRSGGDSARAGRLVGDDAPHLTLPMPKGRGFFLQPADLTGRNRLRSPAVLCPEAFARRSVLLSACPAVPTADARILRAALRSRSSTNPQRGHTWVRIDRLFLTRSPQPEQSCVVKRGETATTGTLGICP